MSLTIFIILITLYNFPILANLAKRLTLDVLTKSSKGTTVTKSSRNQLVKYSCTISYIFLL